MIVLVLNAGSSSLKFQLVRTDLLCIANHLDEKLARGTIERIGGEAIFTLRGRGDAVSRGSAPMRDVRAAIEYIVTWLASAESGPVIGSVGEVQAIGHRVQHGGEQFLLRLGDIDAEGELLHRGRASHAPDRPAA